MLQMQSSVKTRSADPSKLSDENEIDADDHDVFSQCRRTARLSLDSLKLEATRCVCPKRLSLCHA